MRLSKTYLSIVSASLIQSSAVMASSIDGTFVQQELNGDININPIFKPEIINQIHYLIKRSYRITDRRDTFDYLYPEKLTHRRSNSFGKNPEARKRSCSTGDSDSTKLHYDKWFLHTPFTGIHGVEHLDGLVGMIPKIPCAVELDYPGFVAYLPREDERPPLIAVIFRGSQAKSFQSFGGILGPSWLTNFCAVKAAFPETLSGSEGIAGALFHKGYLTKYLSLRIQLFAHIEDILSEIPEADRANTRIVFTGHSQGAGVALPAALDTTYVLGKKLFGEGFDNNETPRFFVYALSGPNSTGDKATKDLMYKVIGRDNIIRHNSLFDIVTYACPGANYDTEFYKSILSLVGVDTGYHPVGHLAIDDEKSLLIRGFKYNNKDLSDKQLEGIWEDLVKGFSIAIKERQSQGKFSVIDHIYSFYTSMQKCHSFLKAAKQTDGIYSFACINHYGSSTANTFCAPVSRSKSSLLVVSKEPSALERSQSSAELVTKPSHESSFEPRLPEIDLKPCLVRGYFNRELIKNRIVYESPEQVFSSEFPTPREITYADGYISESEEGV